MFDINTFIPAQTIAEEKEHILTPQQQAIIHNGNTGTSNMSVKAGAGCAKTSTEILFARQAPGTCLHISFNSQNAKDTQEKGSGALTAKTFHSLGLAASKRKFNKAGKVWPIIKSLYSQSFSNQYGSGVKEAVSAIKNKGLGINNPVSDDEIIDIIADSDELPYLDEAQQDQVMKAIRAVYNATIDQSDMVDFDDMLYFPVYFNLDFRVDHFDYILIDEDQDLNPIQHMVVEMLQKQTTAKFIAVGDPNQAIYAFRGADEHSHYILAKQLSAIEYSLSQTFRCAKSIVREANRLVPELEAFDHNPEGIVTRDHVIQDLHTLKKDDMLICRNNAPLFPFAMRMLEQRVPFNLTNPRLPMTLKRIIDKIDAKTMAGLRDGLKLWYTKEHDALIRAGRTSRAMAIEDQYQGILSILPECDSPKDASRFFSRLTDPGWGVQLTTVHKAKGLEADRVFILNPSLLQYAGDNQARNLEYVAITRARHELHYLREAK